MSEGYRNIKPSEVPKTVQFGDSERVGQLLVSFGGESGTARAWGAPWRCIVHAVTGKTQFSRYWHEPDGRNEVVDDFTETEPHE
jgi:hypothetical protein